MQNGCHQDTRTILPIAMPESEGALHKRADSLAWVGRTRQFSFDLARAGALVEEVRSAFAIRARASRGPCMDTRFR